jgi:hypothetical protein
MIKIKIFVRLSLGEYGISRKGGTSAPNGTHLLQNGSHRV